MRSRERIDVDMMDAAKASEPSAYPLRLLKAELLTVELLMDVRDLLIEIREQTKEHVVSFVAPDYGKEDEL